MGSRSCAIVHADRNGRSPRPAGGGHVRYAGADFNADMAADPLASSGLRGRGDFPGASRMRVRNYLIAGMKIASPRGFAKPKANSGGTTAD